MLISFFCPLLDFSAAEDALPAGLPPAVYAADK